MALLEVRRLSKSFGGLRALSNVSFSIEPGEILGLIGPNGAGKTTLFHCISGFYRQEAGTIHFRGLEISDLSPAGRTRLGLARTFQLMHNMRELTVLENALVGAFCHLKEREEAEGEARRVLERVGLLDEADRFPQELPVALQKRVGLARALATRPTLLMLDEWMAGLNEREQEEAVALLRALQREMGITLFLTEHVMEVVMPLSQRVIVLDGGQKIAEGPPEEVVRDPRVIEAYLGEGYAKRRAD